VANRARNVVVVALMTMASTHPARVAAAAPGDPDLAVGSRIRSSARVIVYAMRVAAERSPRFRALVEAVHATDGIVYVEQGACAHRRRACLIGVAAAGLNRIVQVRVDRREQSFRLPGLIAHELQHAVEVLGDPSVTDNVAMAALFERIGRSTGPKMFETDAAVQAGTQVDAELRHAALAGN